MIIRATLGNPKHSWLLANFFAQLYNIDKYATDEYTADLAQKVKSAWSAGHVEFDNSCIEHEMVEFIRDCWIAHVKEFELSADTKYYLIKNFHTEIRWDYTDMYEGGQAVYTFTRDRFHVITQ